MLRGWAEHKRISWHSVATFQSIDKYIWARIRAVYLRAANGTKLRTRYRGLYKGQGIIESEGKRLIRLSTVRPIKYPVKKRGINPYENINREYFDKFRMGLALQRVKNILYHNYKNTCPICGMPLQGEERVEIHHIKPRKEGGSNSLKNLQPVHRICHQKITHGRIK